MPISMKSMCWKQIGLCVPRRDVARCVSTDQKRMNKKIVMKNFSVVLSLIIYIFAV